MATKQEGIGPAAAEDAVSGTVVYLDICALKRPFDDARSEALEQRAQIQIEVVRPDQLPVDAEEARNEQVGFDVRV